MKLTVVSKKGEPLTRLQRKAQTRRTLIDAALHLSAKMGFAGLSLREITREAGVAPTTFYRHFHDMDDLGLALIDEVGLLLRQLMRQARRRVGRGGGLTRSSVEVFMEFVQKNGNLFRLLLGERLGSSSSFRAALHAEMNRFIGELTEDLERQSSILGRPLVDAGLAAEAIVAVVFTIGAEALDLPAHSRKQLAERLIQEIRIIFRGAESLAKTPRDEAPTP
jgi:TetR/AcrR family transcriptional regulator, fatty acid biosynthesis regulator